MADGQTPPVKPGRAPREYSTRQVVGIVVLVLVLIFALVNLEKVTVDFVVGQVTMPLFFVIAVPTLLGFLVGYMFRRGRQRS